MNNCALHISCYTTNVEHRVIQLHRLVLFRSSHSLALFSFSNIQFDLSIHSTMLFCLFFSEEMDIFYLFCHCVFCFLIHQSYWEPDLGSCAESHAWNSRKVYEWGLLGTMFFILWRQMLQPERAQKKNSELWRVCLESG